MIINRYFIGGYWCFVMAIGGYYIKSYWWLFRFKSLVVILLVVIDGYFINGYCIINYCWLLYVIL
jgi:hypothetical protein